jgi:hypothetical protein
VRAQPWQATSRVLSATETRLRAGRPGGAALEAVEVEPPKLAKGETSIVDAIENRSWSCARTQGRPALHQVVAVEQRCRV